MKKRDKETFSFFSTSVSLSLGIQSSFSSAPPLSSILKRRDLGGEQSTASDEDIFSEGERRE